jgi:hypothetical protein
LVAPGGLSDRFTASLFLPLQIKHFPDNRAVIAEVPLFGVMVRPAMAITVAK